MSSRSRGMLTERKIVAELEKQGWIVDRARGSQMWGLTVDFFSLWDIIAFKKPEYADYILVKTVQGKTNNKPGKEWMEKARAWKQQFGDVMNLSCEIWVYWVRGKRKSKRGFEIINI